MLAIKSSDTIFSAIIDLDVFWWFGVLNALFQTEAFC